MLCVSRTTIWRICQKDGICNQRYTDISDPDLDAVIHDLVTSYPISGLTILFGHVRILGIRVQRERFRLSMIRVDQERMKVREVIPHIGPIPIVIPLKLFLDLPRDPASQEG